MSLVSGCRLAAKVARTVGLTTHRMHIGALGSLSTWKGTQSACFLQTSEHATTGLRYCSTKTSTESDEVASDDGAASFDKIAKVMDGEETVLQKDKPSKPSKPKPDTSHKTGIKAKDKRLHSTDSDKTAGKNKASYKSKKENVKEVMMKDLMKMLGCSDTVTDPEAIMPDISGGKNLDKALQQNLIVECLKKVRLAQGEKMLASSDELRELRDFIDIQFGGISKTSDKLLLELLLILLKGGDSGKELEESVINEAIHRLPMFTFKEALMISHAVGGKTNSKSRKTLHTSVQSKLVSVLDSTDDPSVLTDVMFELDDKNPEILDIFEARAAALLDLLQPNDLYRLFYFLARNKRTQSFKFIASVKNKLLSFPVNFDKTKLRNLFFACTVLKVNDKRLLTAMSENLLDLLSKDVFQDQRSIALPVLMSCFKLGWNSEELTSVLMKMVETVAAELNPTERVVLLNGIGRLRLKDNESLVKSLTPDFSKTKDSNPELYLQLVRAFTILRRADAKMVQAVLDKTFSNRLMKSLKDEPVYKEQEVKVSMLQLLGYLNVNLGVEATFPEYKEWHKQLQEKMVNQELHGMAKAVGSALDTLAPLSTYTNKHVVTKYGHIVDFEIYIDDTGMARRLKSVKDNDQKVWIKLLNFKDYVKGGKETMLVGEAQLMQEQLKKEHRAIVFIPYYEWAKQVKPYQQTKYLEALILKYAKNTEEDKK